jgi:methionyl-tRNA formyltransferase
MKYIFFGTPEFAATILEKLIKAGFVPEAAVCNPDKPVGRKKIITSPPVKKVVREYVESSRVKIFQPETKNDLLRIKPLLLTTNPDLLIVAAYSQIIPKKILEIPRLGTIGIHPSLLPKYRGASPIQTAILNGDEKTGVTLYLVDERVDHGPILTKSDVLISKSETYKSLHEKLAELGADVLIETLPDIENKIKNAKPQEESFLSYTKKFTTENAFIKPEDLEISQNKGGEMALQIERKIRALNPEPGPWTIINNKRIKLLEAQIVEGKLKLKKIQIEGKPSSRNLI